MRHKSTGEIIIYLALILLALVALALVAAAPHFLMDNHTIYQGF